MGLAEMIAGFRHLRRGIDFDEWIPKRIPKMKANYTFLKSIVAISTAGFASAATVYQIDIDSTNPAGPIATAAGWTSFDGTLGNSSPAVSLDGIDFTVGSADGSRLRGGTVPAPNDLTADFIFDDGAGQAVIFFFGTAGQLPAGTWKVEAWIHESSGGLGPSIVGYRTDGVETQMTDNALEDPVNPAASFTFESDGVARYDLYVRENNTENRSRLNAVRLTLVPEPSSSLLALSSMGFLFLRRRR